MRKGFTLLELIIVIIIIGILATLGFSQYTKIVEKGRSAEARVILGQLRTAQIAYNQEKGTYAALADLSVDAPSYPNCQPTHFFSYFCDSTSGACTAARCLANGKTPNGSGQLMHSGLGGNQYAPPEITLSVNGSFTYQYGAAP